MGTSIAPLNYVHENERMAPMKFLMTTSLAVLVIGAASATHAQAQMRFQGMDRDGNGVITRDEWRGSDQSFRNQDWNGDGVLSGDEVRPGARRNAQEVRGIETTASASLHSSGRREGIIR